MFHNENLVERVEKSHCDFEISYALSSENNVSKTTCDLPLESQSCLVSEEVKTSMTNEDKSNEIVYFLISGERHGRDLEICNSGERQYFNSTDHVPITIFT